MSFERSNNFNFEKRTKSTGFRRNKKIAESIITNEKKDRAEDQTIHDFQENTAPINDDFNAISFLKKKVETKDKKTYKSFYLYQSQFKKLDKLAKKAGYRSTNAFVSALIDAL